MRELQMDELAMISGGDYWSDLKAAYDAKVAAIQKAIEDKLLMQH